MPYAPPEDARPAIARSTTTLAGFHPRKLGHVNSLTGDLAGVTEFYCAALGMRVDRSPRRRGLLAASRRRSPHGRARRQGLLPLPPSRVRADRLGELRVALDHLAQHGRWLAWGPVRHALGQNLAAYVRIPEEECMVELYSDMEQLAADHEPRMWPDDAHSSNTWGILPPRSYFRFDAEAVDWERQGLEALGHPLPRGGRVMALSTTTQATGARTGEQFLEGLRQGGARSGSGASGSPIHSTTWSCATPPCRSRACLISSTSTHLECSRRPRRAVPSASSTSRT